MSQKSTSTKIQNNIISNIQFHCMSISDMIYHVRASYPGIPDNMIADTIHMMINENILKVSISVNGVNLYSNLKNQTLIHRIWIYLIQMNYSSSYADIVDAFGMPDQKDIDDAIGILVAKNIITKNKTTIRMSKIERQNIIYTNHNASN